MTDETQAQPPVEIEGSLTAKKVCYSTEVPPETIEKHTLAITDNESTDPVEPDDPCKVKVLYEGPSKCGCCINWVEDEPKDVQESIKKQTETEKYGLLIRMRKPHGDGKTLALDSIVIQNTYLKGLLGQLFSEYNGITTTLRKLVFRPPFHEFVYEWKRFNELCESESDPAKRRIALRLQSVLITELEGVFLHSEDLAANGVITYDYLWTIFRSGIEVYSSQSGYDCIYKLVKTSYAGAGEQSFFLLEVQSICCNGREFGWATSFLSIQDFPGTKTLTELEVIPISLHPRSQDIKSRAEERGRAARDYQTVPYHYASYHGTAKSVKLKVFNVSGRIVIDAASHELFNPEMKISLKSITSLSSEAVLNVSDDVHNNYEQRESCARRCTRSTGRIADRDHTQRPMPINAKTKGNHRELPSLSDEFLYLCSPEVRGYCLQNKKWGIFNVDLVEPVHWNENAFQNVVIDQDIKRLLLAFVESQAANKDGFDDIIKGKGTGLIMLLEGSPGVGKTLTAEAIADRVKRPLYTFSGGELGEDAYQVEKSLDMVLQIAAKWDAVLLLDECDVFLEQRNNNNLRQNSIVAVLLRLLEYYRGILFMTTNRVSAIDPAFQSRVHLTIEYPELGQAARHQIWTYFLRTHYPESCIRDSEIQELARMETNGHEIKNLIKTARLLAKHEDTAFTAEKIWTVIRVFKLKNVVQRNNECQPADKEASNKKSNDAAEAELERPLYPDVGPVWDL